VPRNAHVRGRTQPSTQQRRLSRCAVRERVRACSVFWHARARSVLHFGSSFKK
jgi:hypothetical protein